MSCVPKRAQVLGSSIAERVVGDRVKRVGVFAGGEIFDAREFLSSLGPPDFSIEIP
jgi:hypothetical protein